MPLQEGQSIAPYRVESKVGEGGMGEAYRAGDTRLSGAVALNVLPDAFAADGDRIARPGGEAQLLAALSHPNIGAIHGRQEEGPVRCLVLELIERETLAERLERGPLPLEEPLAVGRQIAEALGAPFETIPSAYDYRCLPAPDGRFLILVSHETAQTTPALTMVLNRPARLQR